MLELLAPAGSMEAVTAAVQNGADAVYLGYGDFNARRNAKNFTGDEAAAAVSYCHLRGVKVFLTLNTLLTDRELAGAAQEAAQASAMGVDAVLVQDLGVLRMLRQTGARPAGPRLHPDDSPQPGRGEAVRRPGDEPGWSSPGSCPGTRSPTSVSAPPSNRGLRPRGPVHVLLGAVLFIQRHRQALGKPRAVRPAVPASVRLRQIRGDAVSAEPERQLPH